jgi:3'-phosphoadenosine 5'-phosphosulfate sulfotransferase (PAPS reductase)/FAD synthetase
MESAMQAVDIMIHIDEMLDTTQQQAIEAELREIEGVIAPRFNKPHLLVISYNADSTNTAALLKTVKDRGCRAQVVAL